MQADDYQKIDQYLQDELPEAEKTAFLARLKQEPDLADELQTRQEMHTYLRTQAQLPELEKKMAGLSAQYFGDAAKPRVRQMARRRLFYVMGVAAAIALLLLVWNPFSQGGLYDQFAEHPALAFVEKGAGEEQLMAAERAFAAGEYEEAYTALGAVLSAGTVNPQLQLALGISALETGQTDEALSLFSELATGTTALREYGQWYQILTYVKMEDFPQAIQLLQNNQFNDPLLKEQAAALRSELE